MGIFWHRTEENGECLHQHSQKRLPWHISGAARILQYNIEAYINICLWNSSRKAILNTIPHTKATSGSWSTGSLLQKLLLSFRQEIELVLCNQEHCYRALPHAHSSLGSLSEMSKWDDKLCWNKSRGIVYCEELEVAKLDHTTADS